MEHKSSRVLHAFRAADDSVNDFFGGWEKSDFEFLSWLRPDAYDEPMEGEILDWLGVRTLHKFHAWMNLPPNRGVALLDIPIPDDQVHAEAIEYVALRIAIDKALEVGDKRFVAYELGASYAPWAVAAGVVAKRKGFNFIELVALEASIGMIESAKSHARMNNLEQEFSIIHGALSVADQVMYFPTVNVALDNGAQVSSIPQRVDYRGLNLSYEEVKGYTLKMLTEKVSRVDFLHMDVQGAEKGLLENEDFLSVLNEKVATFFLATQSRLIEGLALEKLSASGWRLIRERPTMYKPNGKTTDVNGWTLRDGGMIWANSRFD